jgi:hypothetical protein
MAKTAAKRKPEPPIPEPSIEDRIRQLHAEIDALVAAHVDKIVARAPGVPRGMLEHIALARAPGGGDCRCGVYRFLNKDKN